MQFCFPPLFLTGRLDFLKNFSIVSLSSVYTSRRFSFLASTHESTGCLWSQAQSWHIINECCVAHADWGGGRGGSPLKGIPADAMQLVIRGNSPLPSLHGVVARLGGLIHSLGAPRFVEGNVRGVFSFELLKRTAPWWSFRRRDVTLNQKTCNYTTVPLATTNKCSKKKKRTKWHSFYPREYASSQYITNWCTLVKVFLISGCVYLPLSPFLAVYCVGNVITWQCSSTQCLQRCVLNVFFFCFLWLGRARQPASLFMSCIPPCVFFFQF